MCIAIDEQNKDYKVHLCQENRKLALKEVFPMTELDRTQQKVKSKEEVTSAKQCIVAAERSLGLNLKFSGISKYN